MCDQTLAFISAELVKAGQFLNEFSGEKLKCIESFCSCKSIVQWIRDTTEGDFNFAECCIYMHTCIIIDVGDLQNFVNVALATSAGGEDDFANDKLSSLRTVGSGFASLIYELKEDTGSLELRRRCSSVWAAFINYPNLPELLVCWRYNYINLC